jgi:hypothetical protein
MQRLIHFSRRVLLLFDTASSTVAQQAGLAAPRRARRGAIGALMLAAIFASLLYPSPGLTQTAEMTDPLRGERRLLPLDDVLVYDWAKSASTSTLNALLSSENEISQQDQAQIAAGQETFGISAGKMFTAPQDTIAVAQSGQMNLFLGSTSPAWSGSVPNPVTAALSSLPLLIRPLMEMGDFTGDGYAELVIGSSNSGLQVASPVDVTDPSQGVRWGDFYSNANTIAGSALTTGDFDGNGLAEVALAYPVPGSGSTPATGFIVEIYKVDPTELWLSFGHSVTVNSSTYGQGSFPIRKLSISAGDFDNDVSGLGLPDEELVVTLSGEDANDDHFAIQTFQVFSTLQPVATYGEVYTDVAECAQGGCAFVSTMVDSGRLDFTGPLDQAVVGINGLSGFGVESGSEFWILSFGGGENLEFDVVTQQQTPINGTGSLCTAAMSGLAIGNFDRPAQGAATFPLSLSIAVLQTAIRGLRFGGVVIQHLDGRSLRLLGRELRRVHRRPAWR